MPQSAYKGEKMKNIDGFESKKANDWNITPCDVIFKYVEKPKDYIFCKSMNVFNDKWRVNIYSRREIEGIEGKYISSSYFIKMNSTGDVEFVSPKI